MKFPQELSLDVRMCHNLFEMCGVNEEAFSCVMEWFEAIIKSIA